MLSITTRLLVSTGLILTCFVILVALSVSYSVHQRAETARMDSLRGLIYGILGATDIAGGERLRVNTQALPDLRLNQVSSGLMAEIISGTGQVLWQSESVTISMPAVTVRPIGDWYFETVQYDVEAMTESPVHRLQLSTAWEFDSGEELPFTVHVVDQQDSLSGQLRRFNRTLWASLLVTAALLLGLLLLVLRQSLKPLHDISQQVADIEKGDRDELLDEVPRELATLVSGLNDMLRAERQRHTQYRHLLGDLSHNLKTPLTVLQNLANTGVSTESAGIILEQANSMQASLKRYSQRANIRAPRYLYPMMPVYPLVNRLTQTLEKLYREPPVVFSNEVSELFAVRMDEADLLEALGNILENACKYGAKHVWISSMEADRTLVIEDDGPGFPNGNLEHFKARGVRADSSVSGTGMGLAVTQQLLGNNGGNLILAHSPHGGARVTLSFV